jgi:phosphoribosyl-AMP cyclohydrolase
MHEGAYYQLDESVLALLKNSSDLVAAIAQDSSTNQVLMLAWMNQEALAQTLATGQATYWSRSRNELWVKGATSGHTQKVVSLSLDCDGDAILLKVEQVGAACHTGEKTCFHRELVVGTA